jgi:D-lactate dehydrogenase
MCCGVVQNAYHTLESMTFVLPSGTLIDTSRADADAELRAREPALADGLLALRREIEELPALRDRIRAKYRMKNTTGYSLNALLDFERPVDILAHLFVGSEGTLGFIAEAVLRTVPDLPVKYTGLLLFPGLHAACAAIAPLRDAGAVALELMDRASLRSVERRPGVPEIIRGLPDDVAGLLVEFQAGDETARVRLEDAARLSTGGLSLLMPPHFTHAATEQAQLWAVRQGLFPSVGAVRRSGTTVIIEDVAFPVPALADAAVDLTRLFARHAYHDAIIFGHAKDGNLHFVITQSFNTASAVDHYARFMDDVVRLVVEKYDGALKAEHGTGRNMAPFVEAEWGPDAMRIMTRLKALVDPDHLLNPGVILNRDPRAHVLDVKDIPGVEAEVDTCIECGYCESKCPSRDLTLTPRQRIVVRREMARRGGQTAYDPVLDAIARDFDYAALDTCAVDGLCATACPVSIDTGQLVKRVRHQRHSPRGRDLAVWCAEHFDLVEAAVRGGLAVGHAAQRAAGAGTMRTLTGALRAIARALPDWPDDLPWPARRWGRVALELSSQRSADHEVAVYFPSCITRTMSRIAGEPPGSGLSETLVTLAARAGVGLRVPADPSGTCCGVPFSSKGFEEAHVVAVSRAVDRLWEWSDEGRLAVVIDTSPCTYGLRTAGPVLDEGRRQRLDRLTILDGVEFVHDELLPRLHVARRAERVVLHPVCSLVKMGLVPKLEALASACAREVQVPREAGCCGFAGDRGFLVPELTEAATRREAAEVRAARCDGGCYSSSRTCEIGMTRATGRTYRSFLYLVEAASRPVGSG